MQRIRKVCVKCDGNLANTLLSIKQRYSYFGHCLLSASQIEKILSLILEQKLETLSHLNRVLLQKRF